MKHFLLAAAAVIATPALAQTTSAPTTPDQTMPAPNDASQPAPQTTMPAPQTSTPDASTAPAPADTAAPSQQAPSQQPMAQTAPATNDAGDPVGGYQPAGPALSGTPTAGAPVTFQAAPSPDQAYPAPAPLASYPVCKPGQFDNCLQGRGSTHSRQVRRRARR